jgi:hypothetical protein
MGAAPSLATIGEMAKVAAVSTELPAAADVAGGRRPECIRATGDDCLVPGMRSKATTLRSTRQDGWPFLSDVGHCYHTAHNLIRR